jgi:hypothetical protein
MYINLWFRRRRPSANQSASDEEFGGGATPSMVKSCPSVPLPLQGLEA